MIQPIFKFHLFFLLIFPCIIKYAPFRVILLIEDRILIVYWWNINILIKKQLFKYNLYPIFLLPFSVICLCIILTFMLFFFYIIRILNGITLNKGRKATKLIEGKVQKTLECFMNDQPICKNVFIQFISCFSTNECTSA